MVYFANLLDIFNLIKLITNISHHCKYLILLHVPSYFAAKILTQNGGQYMLEISSWLID